MGFLDRIFDPGGAERDAAARAAREAVLRSGLITGPGGALSQLRVLDNGAINLDVDIGNLAPLREALRALVGGRLAESTRGIDPLLAGAAASSTASLADLGPLAPLTGVAAPGTGMRIDPGAVGSFGSANALLESGVLRGIQQALAGGAAGALDLAGGAGDLPGRLADLTNFAFGDRLSSALGDMEGAFAGASRAALEEAGTDFADLAGQKLALLREGARPFEERAFSDLQDSLFAQGRMGTTGGGLQMEAFARGLAQADTQRQLEALNLARQAREDATARALGFSGESRNFAGLTEALRNAMFSRQLGAFEAARGLRSDAVSQALGLTGQVGALRGLEGSLVDSAFARALQSAGLNLQSEQFDRSLAADIARFNAGLGVTDRELALRIADMNANRALSRFDIAGRVLDDRLRNQVAQQGLGLQALAGLQGIDRSGLESLAMALNAAIARSNAQQGVASNLSNIAGQATQAGLGVFSNLIDFLDLDF